MLNFLKRKKPMYELYLQHREEFIRKTGYPPTRVNVTLACYEELIKELRGNPKYTEGLILYKNKREALQNVLCVRVYIKGVIENEKF